MTVQVSLAPRLDLPAAGPLAEAILAHQGQDLTLDGAQVTHLGGLCLQVIASAAQTWRADGHGLHVTPRSEEFDTALTVFGLTAEAIQSEATG